MVVWRDAIASLLKNILSMFSDQLAVLGQQFRGTFATVPLDLFKKSVTLVPSRFSSLRAVKMVQEFYCYYAEQYLLHTSVYRKVALLSQACPLFKNCPS
jgi:hypothetical protein